MNGQPIPTDSSLNIQTLWAKYEDIAMHFNDLLMRLRSQSLAGIAAISTLVGVFTREGIADVHMDWLVAAAIFVAMAFFWVAIWCLDFFYYNRLLIGAISAITALEEKTKNCSAVTIDISTMIEGEFRKPSYRKELGHLNAVLTFYGIVFGVIIIGAFFSWHMYGVTDP